MTPLKALLDTINPREGNGLKETIIFALIIGVLLVLNILDKPVSAELQYCLYTILGYLVGTNVKKKIDTDKDAEKEKEKDAI